MTDVPGEVWVVKGRVSRGGVAEDVGDIGWAGGRGEVDGGGGVAALELDEELDTDCGCKVGG